MMKILIMGSRNVYSIFIPLFGCQVSGVSVPRRRWPEKFNRLRRAACLIKIETFGTRIRIRPLLGFAFRYNNGRMKVGLSATKPNKALVGSTQHTKYKVAKDRPTTTFEM